MLARPSPNLIMNLIIKVLGQTCIAAMLIWIAGGSNKLLELNASNEVLVLRRHETIVL